MRFAIVCTTCKKEQVWYGKEFNVYFPHTLINCPWCGWYTMLHITEDETSHDNEIKGGTIDVQRDTHSQEG